jgi:hypothetical protein
VTDASGLKRFFEERYLHVVQPHRLGERKTLVHRTALKSFWTGDKPTSGDLLRQLEDPFQVGLIKAHLVDGIQRFGLGGGTVVEALDFERKAFTIDSQAAYCGIKPEPVRAEMKRVERAVKDGVKRYRAAEGRRADRLVRDQERAWRNRRERDR